MAISPRQQVSKRLITYLQASGVRLTASEYDRVDQLLDAVLAEGLDDVEARALARLSQLFALPSPQIPMQRPAMMRGSIGYWPHA